MRAHVRSYACKDLQTTLTCQFRVSQLLLLQLLLQLLTAGHSLQARMPLLLNLLIQPLHQLPHSFYQRSPRTCPSRHVSSDQRQLTRLPTSTTAVPQHSSKATARI